MKLQCRSAYISRDLQVQSAFRQILEAHGVVVEEQSLIHFEPVLFTEVPDAEWVFFYSSRAVRFFLGNLPYPLPVQVRLACIGPSTAQVAASLGYEVAFTGTGEPDAVAEAFVKVASGQRVLFPRARYSRQSVQNRLGSALKSIDLIVYDNQPASDFPLRRSEVLVFTSPLNAKTYLSRYKTLPGQELVAIGAPTASACRGFGKEPVLASAPNERALAQAVLSCLTDEGKHPPSTK